MGIKRLIISWLIIVGNVCKTSYVKNAVQLRISESEFNKVASALRYQEQDLYETDVTTDKLNGMYNGMEYEFDELIHKFTLEDIYIRILRDGMLVVTQRFSNIQLLGALKITSLNRSRDMYDGDFDVTMENVTLLSTSHLGITDTVVPTDNQHVFDMYSFNCSADVGSIVENKKTLKGIDELRTNGVMIEMFKNAVCHLVKLRLPTGFGGSKITFRVFDQLVFVSTVASGLEMKNKTFLITYAIKTPSKVSGLMQDYEDNIPIPFPEIDKMREPFEVVIRMNALNKCFREFLEKLGFGINEVSVADVLPILKNASDINSDDPYMMLLFPEVNDIYPESVVSIVVHDAEIYFTAKNRSLQMHFDITCEMSVTLRCDINRTYSAFNFTMNLFFPAKVGCDNKYLTFKLLGFGGNFTVQNSTVGHIVDMETLVLLYNVPYHASGGLKKLNEKIRGIPLTDFLPEDIFTTVNTISIKEDSITVGGSLLPSDPQLPIIERSELVWVGNDVSMEHFFLSGRDRTPKDLAPEEQKTCEKPQSVTGSANMVTYHAVLICIMSSIMYI